MRRNYRIPKSDVSKAMLGSNQSWNVWLARATKRPVHIDVRIHLMVSGGLDYLDDSVRWFGHHILIFTARSAHDACRHVTGKALGSHWRA